MLTVVEVSVHCWLVPMKNDTAERNGRGEAVHGMADKKQQGIKGGGGGIEILPGHTHADPPLPTTLQLPASHPAMNP